MLKPHSTEPAVADPMPTRSASPEAITRALGYAMAAACCVLLTVKFALIWRLNINWDEFFFLSHVHELARGELTLLFQGAYTHLFRWLTALPADEAGQIIAARLTMWALFAATAVLIWRLAATWTSPAIAVFAPLCYLAMLPIVKHGASFRFDSLIAPLSVLALVLLATPRPSRRRLFAASIALGAALATTPKAVFLAPVIAALLILTELNHERAFKRLFIDAVLLGALTLAWTAVFMLLHKLTIQDAPVPAAQFAGSAAAKTLLDTPFFPRAGHYYETRYADSLAWNLLYAGLFISVLVRRYRPAAACALALTPILFYRNAFPYYYIVMLAPACVLVAVTADAAYSWLLRRARPLAVAAVGGVLAVAFLSQGLLHAAALRHDEQSFQRALITGVHEVFPMPAPYIDHSGMIASFRKVNFFMSTWGIEEYRDRKVSFMETALAEHRPPLLLVNRPILDTTTAAAKWLLPRDRELIQRFYQPYWGPIWVAGGAFRLEGTAEQMVSLPFPGAYRLEGPALRVDGLARNPGDVIDVQGTTVRVQAMSPAAASAEGRLLIASAQPPPKTPPPLMIALYTGL